MWIRCLSLNCEPRSDTQELPDIQINEECPRSFEQFLSSDRPGKTCHPAPTATAMIKPLSTSFETVASQQMIAPPTLFNVGSSCGAIVELGRSSHLLLFTMMAVPAQLAEMEIGWVLRSAVLCYPLVVDVENWSFNSQNG